MGHWRYYGIPLNSRHARQEFKGNFTVLFNLAASAIRLLNGIFTHSLQNISSVLYSGSVKKDDLHSSIVGNEMCAHNDI